MNAFFSNPEFTVEYFYNSSGLLFSKEFLNCAGIQLSAQFKKRTGLNINKHISFTAPDKSLDTYINDVVSKLKLSLYVNHNWNPIEILWRSKSGRVYEINDTDIDCNDIEFWMEPLDVVEIHKQMFPKEGVPFKIKQLSYELIVTRFNNDCTFKIDLIEKSVLFDKLKVQVADFIRQYNEKSEKSKKFKGLVHNCTMHLDAESIICELDMGSAGFDFIKKFLLFFDGLEIVKSIEIY